MLISVSDEVIYKWMQWRLCKCTIAFLAILSILSMQVKMFSKYWGNLKINPCILYLFSPRLYQMPNKCCHRWHDPSVLFLFSKSNATVISDLDRELEQRKLQTSYCYKGQHGTPEILTNVALLCCTALPSIKERPGGNCSQEQTSSLLTNPKHAWGFIFRV